MNTVFLAFIDKEFPPNHSFVDGMLVNVLAAQTDIYVRLYVSERNYRKGIIRYRDAVCIPKLYVRRGIGRFLNFFVILRMLVYHIQRERARGRRIVLFVRNDPIYLLATSFLRLKADKLIFQSSFPHEVASRNPIKRWGAKVFYKIAIRNIDAILAVSPLGLERVRRLCPTEKQGTYIPLLSDLHHIHFSSSRQLEEKSPIRFIYIGTHSPSRELSLVMQAITKAFERRTNLFFQFIGGTSEQIQRLRSNPDVERLVRSGYIEFIGRVDRSEIPRYLTSADVGLSLIPPKPIYREASPTKLAEYFGAGLAVLASNGVDLQEEFVMKSSAGVLVNWDIDEIADALIWFGENINGVIQMKENARKYAHEELTYKSQLDKLLALIDGKET